MRDLFTFQSLSREHDLNPLLRLAIPLIITGLINSSGGFFQTFFLAHLNEQALAAGALVGAMYFTLISLLLGIFNSINILVAYQYGAKDYQKISLILRDGLIIAILLVVPAFLLVWNMATILLWLGQKPELASLANLYLHGLSWGLFPRFIILVLLSLIIGVGDTQLSMIFMIISVPVQIILSYVLIFGQFGFPKLGIAGAGWSLTIVNWINVIVICMYLLSNQKYKNFFNAIFTFKKPNFIWEILKLGTPIGLMFSIEIGFFFALALLMGLISTQTLAATQITTQFLGPLMGIIFSLAQAITVRIGHQMGAKQIESAERTGYAGIYISLILMMLVSLFYWLIPEMFIAVDLNIHNPNNFEIIKIAKQFFYIAAFFQMIEAVRIALFGTLLGLKDAQYSFWVSVISFWCISLPVGYVLAFNLKMNGNGFWLGIVLGAICSVVLLYPRFRSKIKTDKNY
jgi:multidrug resistance protein, MATE family